MVKRFIWFFVLGVMAVSCLEEPECFGLYNNQVGFTFRVMGSGVTETKGFAGVRLSGAVVDRTFERNFTGTRFTIPIDLFDEETTILIQGLDNADKSITLNYDVKAQFVSEDCGTRYDLSALKIAEYSGFDSIRVINGRPSTDSVSANNIDIYRCPNPNRAGVEFRQLLLNAQRQRTSELLSVSLQNIQPNFTTDPVPNAQGNSITLPVNLKSSSTQYRLTVNGEEKSLLLNYDADLIRRYRPCGEQIFVSNILVGEHNFDSVRIARDANTNELRNALTDPTTTNIQIYKCPTTNLAQIAFKRTEAGATVNNTVSLVSVRADDVLLYQNLQNIGTLLLPLNKDADKTTFTLQYADRTEILTINYRKTLAQIFNACKQQTFFSRLSVQSDAANARVLATDSVRFPAVTNIEILTN